MMRVQTLLFAIIISAMPASNASAELTQQLKIGGQTLHLNGSGTRTKAFVQIYESGLYLLSANRDAQAILAADELMAIRVQITSGFVSRDSLVASLEDGLHMSTGGMKDKIADETKMFVETLKDEVKKNDIYDFVHVPNKGLYILKNGKMQGMIPSLTFKKALFGIWLSDSPVDKSLRHAMLSGARQR